MTHTQRATFVQKNWMFMDDFQLAKSINRSTRTVARLREENGLIRKKRHSMKNKESIAMVIEKYASGFSYHKVSKLMNVPLSEIISTVEKHYITKTKSKETFTIILESKINYND